MWPTLTSHVAPPGERKQTIDRCPMSLHRIGHQTTNPSQVANHFDDQIPLQITNDGLTRSSAGCFMGTAIKHAVPDPGNPSFVIFDIRTL